MNRLAEIEAALRAAFPHFQNEEPITAEGILEIGREWMRNLMKGPDKEITFTDQDGNERKLVYERSEAATGPYYEGYCIPEDADWSVIDDYRLPMRGDKKDD